MTKSKLKVVIIGPMGSGKTALALRIVEMLHAEQAGHELSLHEVEDGFRAQGIAINKSTLSRNQIQPTTIEIETRFPLSKE